MAKKNYRSAETGRYITKKKADKSPSKSVAETRKPPKKGKGKK